MQNGIVIKSSRAGMTVLLDPNLPFEELLAAIAKKFKDCARFWGAVQMTLTLEGRRLTPVSYTHLDVYKRQTWKGAAAWRKQSIY